MHVLLTHDWLIKQLVIKVNRDNLLITTTITFQANV